MPDLVMQFDEMPGGGQAPTMANFATVGGSASITGATGRVVGTLYTAHAGPPPWNAPLYYPWLGWPVVAWIPGDIFNAKIYGDDPPYEYGGSYVEHGVISQLMGVGGENGLGSYPWPFKLVSQRCWLLLLMAPEAYYAYTGAVEPILGNGIWYFDITYELGPGAGVPGVGSETGVGPGQRVGTTTTVPNTSGGGRTFSKSDLVALYTRHNFPDPNITAAIALAESGGDPSATHINDDGSTDYGLLQINSIHGYDPARLFDPDYNADAGYEVSSGGSDYTPWVTYNSGAYLDFV